MVRSSEIIRPALTLLALLTAQATFAGTNNASNDTIDQAISSARMNCGAYIECVTPDGHAGQVSRVATPDPAASAVLADLVRAARDIPASAGALMAGLADQPLATVAPLGSDAPYPAAS